MSLGVPLVSASGEATTLYDRATPPPPGPGEPAPIGEAEYAERRAHAQRLMGELKLGALFTPRHPWLTGSALVIVSAGAARASSNGTK